MTIIAAVKSNLTLNTGYKKIENTSELVECHI